MRFSVRARAQNALFRRMCFSLPAQTWSHLTQRRILRRRSHVKAQSALATSRKGVPCAGDATRDVTERRILGGRRHGKAHFACGPHQRARSACGRWLRREAVFAGLCTLLRTHGRSRDRAGPWAPRHRGTHGPRDAQVPGPEVHATGAVTQPPTRAHEASSEPIVIENSQAGCANASNGGINPADSTPRASSNAANQAGSSYFPLPHAITFDEQLPQMERRGLVVEDRDFAISKLQDLSYYRLCD